MTLFGLDLLSALALAAVAGPAFTAEDLRPRPLPEATAGLIFGRLKDGTLIGITQLPASPGSKDQVIAARYSRFATLSSGRSRTENMLALPCMPRKPVVRY